MRDDLWDTRKCNFVFSTKREGVYARPHDEPGD